MNKVIILLGPTGVGKTGVSILLAKILNTEIISADSMQIYRLMDIGTAKPTLEERQNVTHHMIDVADPWDTYSTGKYVTAVKPIIEDLLKRGKIPIITGGTGLYIRAMTKGIFSGPSADWTLREELLTMERESKGALYSSLEALDPDAAAKITPNDTRRIIRALEVCLKSNAKMSDMQKALTSPLPYEFVKVGITRDRKELYRLIEARVDAMMKSGLLEESKNVIHLIMEQNQARRAELKTSGNINYVTPFMFNAFPSMQAIGYKETLCHLSGEFTIDEAASLIKKASKRYAKRQFTWFRREENVHWVDITGLMDPRSVLDRLRPILINNSQIGEMLRPCNIEKNTLC